jgi:hypothetical protein
MDVINGVLPPAVAAGAAGPAIEEALALGIADRLNACRKPNWV